MPSRFAARVAGVMRAGGASHMSAGVPATTAAALGQETAAMQVLHNQVMSSTRTPFGGGWRSAPKRRGKRKAAKVARSNGGRKRKAKRPARLVKGSAAAKRYMASIRRKRRR